MLSRAKKAVLIVAAVVAAAASVRSIQTVKYGHVEKSSATATIKQCRRPYRRSTDLCKCHIA